MSNAFPSLHALFSNTWGIVLMVLLFDGSIFVHELGHFLAARWNGLKVDRFSIGFGPRVFGWKGKDGVEYQLLLLPLGGFVALPQLVDLRELEGDPSTEARDLPPVAYGPKMMVLAAGAAFNMLFAIALACVLWVVGVPTPMGFDSNVVGYVYDKLPGLPGKPMADGPAFAAGLRPGDKILAVDGHAVDDFRDLQTGVALGSGRTADGLPLVHLTFERGGVVQEVDVKPVLQDMNSRAGDAIRQIGVEPAQKLEVEEVSVDSPAQRAGLKDGDVVTAMSGAPMLSFDQFKDALAKSGTQAVTLAIQRAGPGNSTSSLAVPVQPVPVPLTPPLATLRFSAPNGVVAAELDVAPEFADGAKGDPALPGTPAVKLVVARLDNPEFFNDGLLQTGDVITAVNGKAVHSVADAVAAWVATGEGAPVRMEFSDADGQRSAITLPGPFAASVTPAEERMMVGLVFQDQEIDYVPPWRQFDAAVAQTLATLGSLLNPHSDVGIKMLSGPVGIGRVLYKFSVDDIRLALWFTVILNINLAILNLLPIPVLDGGHMLMATIAWLRGRALPVQLVMATQGVFLVLIVGLMLFKLYQDSVRWMGDRDVEAEMMQEDSYGLKVGFPASTTPSAPALPAPAKP
jgi:RIP metalloprotease RseP